MGKKNTTPPACAYCGGPAGGDARGGGGGAVTDLLPSVDPARLAAWVSGPGVFEAWLRGKGMADRPIDRALDAVEWRPTGAGPKADGLPWATHEGLLTIGGLSLRCFTLNDGRRIFDADDVHRFLGILGEQPEG